MKNLNRLAWLVAVLLALWAARSPAQQEREFEAGKWVTKAAPAKGTAEGELALIHQQMDRGHHRRVVSAAKKFLKRYGDDPGREEVMLLGGEAEVGRGRLFQGYEWFEKQLAEFPAGRFSDRALEREFAVAEGFLAGRKRVVMGIFRLPARDDGLEILSRVAEHAPGSALAEQALMRIADDHYAHKERTEAAEAYDRYLAAFPSGGVAGEAMLKAANATYESFNGIAFDETPLIEAEQRYRTFAQRHPISAKEAGVDVTLEDIRTLRAEKVLAEGRFYERVGRPGAAAFSYRYVVERYPQTPPADRAAAALARLGGQAGAPGRPAGPAAAPAQVAEKPRPRTEGSPASQAIDLETLLPTTAPEGDTK